MKNIKTIKNTIINTIIGLALVSSLIGCGDEGCCSNVDYRDIDSVVRTYDTADIIYSNTHSNNSIILQDTLNREADACSIVGGEILYYVGSKTIVNCMSTFN